MQKILFILYFVICIMLGVSSVEAQDSQNGDSAGSFTRVTVLSINYYMKDDVQKVVLPTHNLIIFKKGLPKEVNDGGFMMGFGNATKSNDSLNVYKLKGKEFDLVETFTLNLIETCYPVSDGPDSLLVKLQAKRYIGQLIEEVWEFTFPTKFFQKGGNNIKSIAKEITLATE